MITDFSGLLSTKNISKSELLFFFKHIQKSKYDFEPLRLGHRPLKGVLGFFEPSTRTRVSFESAGLDLGIQWIQLEPSSLSLKKGESLQDTFETLNAYDPDFFVIRHQSTGLPHFVHQWTKRPVISAGDGMNEHPTQGLLDAYTLWSLDASKKFKIIFFGDVARSRVARSSLDLFQRLGYSVGVVDDGQSDTALFASAFKISLVQRSALKKADVVYALRVQRERGSLAQQPPLSLSDLGPKTLWMHPGPKIMGEDLSADLCDPQDPRSLILKQAQNGYRVRYFLLKELAEMLSSSKKSARKSEKRK